MEARREKNPNQEREDHRLDLQETFSRIKARYKYFVAQKEYIDNLKNKSMPDADKALAEYLYDLFGIESNNTVFNNNALGILSININSSVSQWGMINLLIDQIISLTDKLDEEKYNIELEKTICKIYLMFENEKKLQRDQNKLKHKNKMTKLEIICSAFENYNADYILYSSLKEYLPKFYNELTEIITPCSEGDGHGVNWKKFIDSYNNFTNPVRKDMKQLLAEKINLVFFTKQSNYVDEATDIITKFSNRKGSEVPPSEQSSNKELKLRLFNEISDFFYIYPIVSKAKKYTQCVRARIDIINQIKVLAIKFNKLMTKYNIPEEELTKKLVKIPQSDTQQLRMLKEHLTKLNEDSRKTSDELTINKIKEEIKKTNTQIGIIFQKYNLNQIQYQIRFLKMMKANIEQLSKDSCTVLLDYNPKTNEWIDEKLATVIKVTQLLETKLEEGTKILTENKNKIATASVIQAPNKQPNLIKESKQEVNPLEKNQLEQLKQKEAAEKEQIAERERQQEKIIKWKEEVAAKQLEKEKKEQEAKQEQKLKLQQLGAKEKVVQMVDPLLKEKLKAMKSDDIDLIKTILQGKIGINYNQLYNLIVDKLGTIEEKKGGSSHKRLIINSRVTEIMAYKIDDEGNTKKSAVVETSPPKNSKTVGGMFKQHGGAHTTRKLCHANIALVKDAFERAGIGLALAEIEKEQKCETVSTTLQSQCKPG